MTLVTVVGPGCDGLSSDDPSDLARRFPTAPALARASRSFIGRLAACACWTPVRAAAYRNLGTGRCPARSTVGAVYLAKTSGRIVQQNSSISLCRYGITGTSDAQ